MFESVSLKRSFLYFDPADPNESAIYRHVDTRIQNGDQLIATFRSQPEANTTIKLLNGSAQIYKNLRCSGERKINQDGSYGNYQWISFSEYRNMIYKFASGLRKIGFAPGDKLGIYSHNCLYWQVSCFATQLLRGISVPIYDSLGPGSAEYIINHSGCRFVVVHSVKLNNLTDILSKTKVEHVIVIGCKVDQLFTVDQILELGVKEEFIEPSPEDTAIIMYTSGSTGKPKGCVLTHRNLIAGGAGLGELGASFTTSDTFISFLPLAHIYEMGVEFILLAQGCAVGFFTGDIRNLMKDIQNLRPTIICGVPRVFNKIVTEMKSKIENLPLLTKNLIKFIIQQKTIDFQCGRNSSLLLDLVLKPFKQSLGGRVRMIISGGAPILPEIYEFMKSTLCPIIIQGYGLTECSASLAVQEYPERNPSNVGGVSICSECKLRRVEGFDYNPRGFPICGELLVRGPHIFTEYYKEPQLTAEAKDNEWLCTGDIVKIDENGLIEIIDRVKMLVKLSQGEYISITSLNDIYGMSSKVKNIYVYADSHHDFPAAVIIPSDKQVENWKSRGIVDVVNSKTAKEEIVEELKEIHRENKLRGFERISSVYLELEDFTVENGLLTPTMKSQWQSLRKKYQNILIELLDHS